ncbi:MAG: pyridoxal-phosphate-dependent aminotransferase family protein [Candidatus Kapaibacterium sp.]
MIKKRIMAPGPTEIPPQVLSAGGEPILHHRTPEFRAIFAEVSEKIKYVFQTKQPVLTLAGGGTGGMEAVIVNLSALGEKIIVISGGVFGERWAKIAEALERKVVRISVEYGKAVKAEDISKALSDNPDAVLLCGTLSETSTGVEHPIEKIAAITKKSNTLFAVDAISGLGACVFKMDEWGVDAVVSGTQKGLMMPPGLALIALSDRTLAASKSKKTPKFYWSFESALSKLTEEKLPDTPWTPNVSLVRQLQESLKLIHAEGIENIWKRHELLSHATREAMKALGLTLFAESPSVSVTSVHSPAGIDSGDIVKKMRSEWGISIVGGQGTMLGKIFRIGHLGYCDRTDVLMTVAALECVLSDLGVPTKMGEGVKAAQQIFLKSK